MNQAPSSILSALVKSLFPRKLLRGSVIFALLALFFSVTAVSPVFSLPVIEATKSDTLIVDNDADNFADPGDTIRYTVWLTNSGTTNAGSVVFDDTIDPNTTLAAGSLRTTPIARNDQYASLGNVGITVSAASGVLANDNDPDGQSISVAVAAGGTANGGTFSLGSGGNFSYLPPPGFEGADSFTYTVQDSDGNQDPATVFITVNEVIWFIDNSQGSSGSGVLTNPFNSISTFNSGAADEAGDTIFIYSGSGNYTSGLTLLNNQILIGQGATATIASIAGITVPPHSNTLPATGGTRPTITTNGVTLGQSNLLRGFNVGNTAGAGISDNGGTVGTLTVSEVAITGSGDGFAADNGGTLAVTLDSLNANSGAHGLSLANTGGSFSVIGTGGSNSGGTLSGHSAEGVLLNNATNVSLTDMVINQSATANTQGIDATDVTGLTLVRTTITAGSSSSYALLGSSITTMAATDTIFDGGGGSVSNIDGVRITNLLGANSFTDSTFRNGKDINLLIENNSNGGGQDTITISGSAFSDSAGGDHLQVEADGTANLKLVVNASAAGNSTFSGTGQDGMQLEAEGNATFEAIVTQATISGNLGSAVNIAAVVNGHMIARVHNLTGLTSDSTNIVNVIGFDSSNIEATVESNSITLDSSHSGNGIRVIHEGNGTITANLKGNTISGNTFGSGILAQARAGSGTINLTIDGNNVSAGSTNAADGIEVTSGSSAGGDSNTICLNMFDNTSSSGGLDGYYLQHRSGTTFRLQDFAGPATSAGITNWVNTVKSNTGSVYVSGASGFTAAPSACATPTVPTAAIPANLIVADAADAAPQLPLRMEHVTAKVAVQAPAGNEPAQIPALSGETVNVTMGTLNAGQHVRITFDVTVDTPFPDVAPQVCNQGVVSGDNFSNVPTDDPAVGGTADPTCTALNVEIDLGITKSVTPTTAIPGRPLTYTLVFSNAGPQRAYGVTIVDDLPDDLVNVSAVSSGAAITPTGAFSYTWGVADLAPNGGGTITVTGVLTTHTPAGSTLDNTATIAGSSNASDTDAGNDSNQQLTPVSDTIRCGLGADSYSFNATAPVTVDLITPGTVDCLTVVRTDSNHPDATGPIMTGRYWTITGVDNTGGTATGYSLSLTLPFATADANDKACRYENPGWNCAADSFVSNVSVTRDNVIALSDWAVGDDVSPTAVTLHSATPRPGAVIPWWVLATATLVLSALTVSALARRHRPRTVR